MCQPVRLFLLSISNKREDPHEYFSLDHSVCEFTNRPLACCSHKWYLSNNSNRWRVASIQKNRWSHADTVFQLHIYLRHPFSTKPWNSPLHIHCHSTYLEFSDLILEKLNFSVVHRSNTPVHQSVTYNVASPLFFPPWLLLTLRLVCYVY